MKQHNHMQTSKCLMLVDLHVFEVLWVFLSMQICLPVHRQMGLCSTEKRGLEKEILSWFVCSDAPTPLIRRYYTLLLNLKCSDRDTVCNVQWCIIGVFFCLVFWKYFSSEIF